MNQPGEFFIGQKMNNVVNMRRYPAKAAWGYYDPKWPLFSGVDIYTRQGHNQSMGDVVHLFTEAESIEVSVNLENVTLEDVLQAMYEKFDMTECTICWREDDGGVRMAGDLSHEDSMILLEDIIEQDLNDG